MKKVSDISAYLISGRLADVIAALQVMSTAMRPERRIIDWAHEFDKNRNPDTVEKWTRVFQEHPEFFVTYYLREHNDLKAALRWRYVFKTYDAETGQDFTPAEVEELSKEKRELLTTKPLEGDQIQTLLNTAISLHTRAIEESKESRWWIPVLAATLGFFGAILGAMLSTFLSQL